MIDMYFYETDVLTPTQFNQIETKLEEAKSSLITMGFNIPTYQKTTWSLQSYLLAKYIIKIENALKEIADIKGTNIETREWNINGKDSFSYKDLNRWIKAYNLAYEELGQYYLASFTNFTTIENIKSKKLINLQLYGNTSQNGTPTPTTPVNVEVVTGRQDIEVCGRNLLKSNLDIIKANNTAGTWNGNTYTLNNVSFTYNEDGSITANGTASANTYFYISRNTPYEITTLPAGTYYFTSHEYTGANDTWKIQFNTGSAINVFGTGSAKEQTRTLTEDINTTATIVVYSEKNPNGATFYPMIAKQSGVAYEKYNGNTYEINLGKQLLDLKNDTYTMANEITAVVNNGEITLNGTTTATRIFTIMLNNTINWKEGQVYSLSAFNSVGNSNVVIRTNLAGTNALTLTNVNASNNITYDSSIARFTDRIAIRIASGTTLTDFKIKPMLEKGQIPTSYSAYKTPIELCKIDTYQDSIKYANYKNICPFDISNAWESGTYGMDGVKQDATARIRLKDLLKVKPSTAYYFNTFNTDYRFIIRTYDSAGVFVRNVGAVTNGNTVTTSATEEYFGISMYNATSSSGVTYNTYITLFENGSIKPFICLNGETDKTYEPYGTGWYIEKNIKKAKLGVDITFSSTTGGFYSQSVNDYATSGNTPYCIWYKGLSNVGAIGGVSDKQIAFNQSSSPYPRLYLKDSNYSSASTLNSDLSANNVSVYYALANPTYTFIEDEEITNVLDNIYTIKPLMNIIYSTSNLQPSAITFEYFK